MFGREMMPRAKDGDDNDEGYGKLVRFPSPTPVERKRTSFPYVKCCRAVVCSQVHPLSDRTLYYTDLNLCYTEFFYVN